MAKEREIITVALSPCWDLTCAGADLRWHDHKVIESFSSKPAGKALNVSKALSWLNVGSTAAGLWGEEDLAEAKAFLAADNGLVKIRFTPAAGRTRTNVTVVDTEKKREMHLRDISRLATAGTLSKLGEDLRKFIKRDCVIVFAGSLGDVKLSKNIQGLINLCVEAKAQVVMDASGPIFNKITAKGNLALIKPNLEELGELVGTKVRDSVGDIVKAARTLTKKARMILVSRGAKGAILVTENDAWSAKSCQERAVVSAVGCGDYLLAGFLSEYYKDADIGVCLEAGIKSASAKAWQWHESKSWSYCRKNIKVEIKHL
jgi:1-phosphofructokinase family hexose kinase